MNVRLILIVLLGFIPAHMAAAAEENSASADLADRLCQVMSSGNISYRTGECTWLTQGTGAYSAVLPLQVKTREFPGRVQIGDEAFFEASASSEFDLKRLDNGAIALSVKRGAVLYALAPNAVLQTAVPSLDTSARSGSIVSEPSETEDSVFIAASDTGIIRLAAPPVSLVEFTNVQGSVAVEKSGETLRDIPEGQCLRVSNDPLNSGPPIWLAPLTAAIDISGGSPDGAGSSQNAPLGTMAFSADADRDREGPIGTINDTWQVKMAAGDAGGSEYSVESPNAKKYRRPPNVSPPHPDWEWCWRHWRWHPKQHKCFKGGGGWFWCWTHRDWCDHSQ